MDYVEIPAVLKSLETYIFIGFDAATATSLWHRYVHYADEVQGDFFDFALWHIEYSDVEDSTSGHDDWNECMRRLGINEKLRIAIMMPEYEDIRYTATCKFWVKDALKMNYEALEELEDELRMTAARIQHSKKVPQSRKAPSSLLPSSPSLIDSVPRPSLSAPPSDLAIGKVKPTAIPSSVEDDESATVVASATVAPVAIPGYTILWRAGSKHSAEAFYNRQTKTINLLAISTSSGDFNASRNVAYWTPQKETADRYAQWTKHKADVSYITIIQVAVPEAFTSTLDTEYLWIGDRDCTEDLWRKMIWHCRRGVDIPKEIRYIYNKDLLIGHIATGIHSKYERMDHYNQIDEKDVLKVEVNGEERRSAQWVFHTERARDGFTEHCRGRVWIHNLGRLKIPVAKDF